MSSATYFRPNIQSPYPPDFEIGDEISDFAYETRLVLAREPEVLMRGKDCETCYIIFDDYDVSYVYKGVNRRITVPRGMLTDLASVPWLMQFIVNRVGRHLEAAIVHDFLFIAWQLVDDGNYAAKKVDFAFANAVMFAAMKEAKVNWFQRMAIKIALRFPFIAWSIYKEKDENIFVDLEGCQPKHRIAA